MVCGWWGIPLTSPSWNISDGLRLDTCFARMSTPCLEQCPFAASLGLLTRQVHLRGPARAEASQRCADRSGGQREASRRVPALGIL